MRNGVIKTIIKSMPGYEPLRSILPSRPVGITKRIKDTIARQLLGEKLTLPIHMRRVEDYLRSRQLGDDVFRLLEIHCSPKFDGEANILDIGSGDGRVAFAFARSNDFKGSYTGLEPNKEWVKACNSVIKKIDKKFSFVHADLYHSYYNPAGATRSESYSFPFDGRHFDLIILNSVFTHLLPAIVKNYLREISRVLATNGMVYATFHILDDEYLRNSQGARYQFLDSEDGYFTTDIQKPENVVGYKESDINCWIENSGLKIEKWVPGYWRRKRESLDQHDQDIYILSKSIS